MTSICDTGAVLSLYHSTRFKYMKFHVFTFILHLPHVYYDLTKWPAPSWRDSSVGRAVHRYRRGHRFQSRSGQPNFSLYVQYTRSVTGRKRGDASRRIVTACLAVTTRHEPSPTVSTVTPEVLSRKGTAEVNFRYTYPCKGWRIVTIRDESSSLRGTRRSKTVRDEPSQP